jgi:hypothetical protein
MTLLTPGQFVYNPVAPEWGLGQVQSVAGSRLTVNFTEQGKLTLNTDVVSVELIDPDNPAEMALIKAHRP